MNALFGTDGVRGVANEFLTPELALALGRAGGHVLAAHGARRPVLVGRDTRMSGPMLEAALCAGLASVGLDVWKVGIVPTPGVAFLTQHLRAAAGVVISASHNPIEDNGFKFFASDGSKLPDAIEDEIAAAVGRHGDLPRPQGADVGEILDRRRVVRAYEQHCVGLGSSLKGLRLIVDAAFGAAYAIAPRVFAALGADVTALHCKPDGRRINVDCGATHLEPLRSAIARAPGSIGVAFDGDADRALFVDENGDVVTGDHVLAIWARELSANGQLPKKTVVATVMSNIGLERALDQSGVVLERTAVGDRYVLEAMVRGGFRIGGEQSGHIIDLQSNSTGDGIATAVKLLSMCTRTGSLHALAQVMRVYPQVLLNVRVKDKQRVHDDAAVRRAIEDAAAALDGQGRVFVRPSGTEPLIRIMVEGPDESQIRSLARTVADVVEAATSRTET
ncbi:MAG: phosphoglucosamine mutase [Candidatus Eremiobacteraeota bacterium]|nr:phosphoglucosamine mutase [Candidatus Eremiobacteraeota bacterium]MBV8367099.1 phosphoglucosamine mutase [Candidatus Eremiobacteraeota bacterium]